MLPRTLSLVALLLASGHAAAADTPTDRGPRASTPVRLPSATGQKLAQPGVRGIAHSVARRWNDELLQAIIRDRPRPTVNARNLYHVSAAMYDAWAAYDTDATPVFRREFGKALDTEAARNEAISHAAYRVCSHRFLTSPGHIASQAAFDTLMSDLGYDINNTSTTGDSPAAIGNRIAASVIAQGFIDSSNEQANFDDNSGYAPVNGPLVVGDPGTGGMNDINHWQPLFNINAVEEQHFLTPHWRDITPFSLTRVAPNVPYANPGPVPLVGGVGDAQMKADLVTMIRWSSQLNPADGVVINISPSVTGNNTLGTEDGTGHPINPATGLPYDDNLVLQGDFGRVLSEFWADGPHSTTPPRPLERDRQRRLRPPRLREAPQRHRPRRVRPRVGHQALPRPQRRHPRHRHRHLGSQAHLRLITPHLPHPRDVRPRPVLRLQPALLPPQRHAPRTRFR